MEPLLKPDTRRLSLFPIKHKDMYDRYLQAQSCFWQAAEVDLSNDRNHFESLPSPLRRWVKFILGFFNVADSVVVENLNQNFVNEVQWLEARCFLTWQASQEVIHCEVYSQLIDGIVESPSEKDELFCAIESMPCIRQKVEWCERWADPKIATFAERVVAWGAAESILFSASFASIFFLKHHYDGKMPGLIFSNELIARDEGLHASFSALMYSKLKTKLSFERFSEIIQSAVSVEQTFVEDALKLNEELPNVPTIDEMMQYVKFIADQTSVMFGYPRLFECTLPPALKYMESIAMVGKSNFFERRVSAYSVKPPRKENKIDFGADF